MKVSYDLNKPPSEVCAIHIVINGKTFVIRDERGNLSISTDYQPLVVRPEAHNRVVIDQEEAKE